MCKCDTAFAVPQGLTRIQVIEDSADAWTQKGAAHPVELSFTSAELAMRGRYIFSNHGINGKTAEDTLRNMGLIASPGMVETEKTIIDILKKKQEEGRA